jgi:transcriptional regulator with XRE-family HTH domain
MITAAQLRAARALLGIDQRELAQRCGLSLPMIQRMEASEGVIRGNVDSLVKLVDALAGAGIERWCEFGRRRSRRAAEAACAEHDPSELTVITQPTPTSRTRP